MVYNAVSSLAILAKVYRDNNIDDNIEGYVLEWIGEALEFIGTGVQLIEKEEWIVSTNHSATLPSDLQQLETVWTVQEAPLKDNWQDEEFPYDLKAIEKEQKILLNRSDQLLHGGIGRSSTDIPRESFNTSGRTSFQELQGKDPQETDKNQLSGNYQETYHLNGNEVKTSFPEGILLIQYKAIPTDENGFPLVPDHISFKEALTWYVTKKLIRRGHNLSMDYGSANQQWKLYCTQARNKATFPDMDEYENFLRSWVQMVNLRTFNQGTYPYQINDSRTGDPSLSGPTGNYRVTESGVTRITEDSQIRETEDN